NNLLRLRALSARFPGFRFGFMDHQEGATEAAMVLSLLALPLGVACIEKHITLDRAQQLEDYISALDPEHFKTFVAQIRNLEKALGSESLDLSEKEQGYRQKVMKVLVANRD